VQGQARPVAALATLAALAAPACAWAGTEAPTYAGVSVATLWTRPAAPRPVDRPALGPRPDLRAWSRTLSTAARRGLVGRVETQALLGEPVLVIARRGRWARVTVPDQPTPRDPRGYPGWVPALQLTASRRFARELRGPIAVVRRPTAWLRATGGRRMELSYGTRLPVVGSAGADVLADTPAGRTGRIRRAAVAVYPSAAAIERPSGRAIVADALRFLGLRYLWGGTSAFGFDCSGLIELIYRAHGIVIPRDADAQAPTGGAVPRARLQPGDAIFYGRSGVHHAALYVGGGRMLEAPNSASRVRLTRVRAAGYAGARRYRSGDADRKGADQHGRSSWSRHQTITSRTSMASRWAGGVR
jgi:gamma-D-glutamyl-L-lysine dipeptidyl-peptidase